MGAQETTRSCLGDRGGTGGMLSPTLKFVASLTKYLIANTGPGSVFFRGLPFSED